MMRTPTLRRIYLAGPEVFLPSARAVGAAKCQLLAAAGLEGVFPHDAALARDGLSKRAQAERIYAANTELMHSCDAMIANLTPFRGVSADVGTAFEVGFMRALGRPVSAYTNVAANYNARAAAFRARRPTLEDCDRPDCAVEDHDLGDNLMLEMAVIASGCALIRHPGSADMADLSAFRQCLAEIAGVFASSR
jgi:nucleoside 2-deoxyribosyltransferase